MKPNYLEIMVPIRKDTVWFKELQQELSAAAIPVKWQREKTHHQTLVFINDNRCVESLKRGFPKVLSSHKKLSLTIDKLEAFTTGKGDEHIVCLTSTHPSEEIRELAKDVRTLAASMDVNYDKRPFKLHITLCRIHADTISLDALQSILSKVSLPVFDCCLDDVQYRYKGEEEWIKRWRLY